MRAQSKSGSRPHESSKSKQTSGKSTFEVSGTTFVVDDCYQFVKP